MKTDSLPLQAAHPAPGQGDAKVHHVRLALIAVILVALIVGLRDENGQFRGAVIAAIPVDDFQKNLNLLKVGGVHQHSGCSAWKNG